MYATIKGRIVKKVESKDGATNIKLELVNYQTVDLVYDASSDGDLPNPQEWVQVKYDEQTNTIANIEHIQEPTLQEVSEERRHFVNRRPFTTFFAALSAILGGAIWFFQFGNIPLVFILIGPFLLFLSLSIIAGKYE